VLCASFLLFSHDAKAAPATFTVTNTNDIGAGSLREAILDANNNGNPSDMDVIEFNIAGSGVHTISPLTALPEIIEKVTLDGYSQPGTQVNTAPAPLPLNNVIKIELDFSGVSGGGYALKTSAANTVIRGLAIFTNTVTGPTQLIEILADNCEFAGNYGNVRADGITLVDNTGELIVGQNGPSVILNFGSGVVGGSVGGSSTQVRNVFGLQRASAMSGSISIEANETIVKGNYIGIAKDGLTDIGGSGVLTDIQFGSGGLGLDGSDIVVGGTNPTDRNIIAGASTYSIAIQGSNNTIQGNYIGTDYMGVVRSSIDNGLGVLINGSPESTLIGGTAAGAGNVIAGVSGTGVGVIKNIIPAFGIEQAAAKNTILGNSIYGIRILPYPEFGSTNQAIDLFDQELVFSVSGVSATLTNQGPNPNDLGDADTGPNGHINSPVLKSAQQIGDQLTITYDLDVADSPTDDYRVEFFANNQSSIFGTGPGEEYLGAATSVAPGTNRTVTLTVSGDYYQKALSATTTAIDAGTGSGFGSTSEFAQNIGIGNGVDLEADGVLDSIEISFPEAPSGGGFAGDGNGDGTPDSEQPNVTTYLIGGVGDGTNDPIFTTFETNGCASTANVTDDAATALPVPDTGYEYPFGVVSFTLNCSRGASATILKYYFTDRDASDLTLRKYKPGSQEFITMPATITNETVAGRPAIKISYSITDGGEYDDDGEANGIIVDPVGLASSTSEGASSGGTNSALADTGENLALLLLGAGTLVTGGVWLSRKAFKK